LKPPLFCITGLTASGKSALALELAQALPAGLLSVDSMQVYRGFDVGTAKPSAGERACVRHFGIDLLEPQERFSAGAFLDYARGVIEAERDAGRHVIAVGGTGLYLRALLHGLSSLAPADEPLRAELRAGEASEPGSMHRRLAAADPASAARLHPHDLVRIERALEVALGTGRPLSEQHAAHGFRESPFRPWIVGIRWNRADLHDRIAGRVDAMLAAGWLDEVRALLARGVPLDCTPMHALGYREVAAHLRGEVDARTLREQLLRSSIQFAKRQATWFNREPSVEWLDPAPDLARRLLPRLVDFLAGGAGSRRTET
jgi:tRNA dimethylallyltransferase